MSKEFAKNRHGMARMAGETSFKWPSWRTQIYVPEKLIERAFVDLRESGKKT